MKNHDLSKIPWPCHFTKEDVISLPSLFIIYIIVSHSEYAIGSTDTCAKCKPVWWKLRIIAVLTHETLKVQTGINLFKACYILFKKNRCNF